MQFVIHHILCIMHWKYNQINSMLYGCEWAILVCAGDRKRQRKRMKHKSHDIFHKRWIRCRSRRRCCRCIIFFFIMHIRFDSVVYVCSLLNAIFLVNARAKERENGNKTLNWNACLWHFSKLNICWRASRHMNILRHPKKKMLYRSVGFRDICILSYICVSSMTSNANPIFQLNK